MFGIRGVAPTGPGPNHAPCPPTGPGPAPYASPNWMYRTPTPGFHSQQGAHIGAPQPAMPPQQPGYPFIQPSGNKLPSSAQPSNCELNMTPEDFRSWRTTTSRGGIRFACFSGDRRGQAEKGHQHLKKMGYYFIFPNFFV